MRALVLMTIALFDSCAAEDPRIAAAEAVAEETCACGYLACAMEAAAPLLEERGLEQEDYANLPADLIARYETAYAETESCMRRWILE